MLEFWNDRYGKTEFAYGESPNLYFAEQLQSLKPGKILLPAEGEGRNAVFAAQNNWEVTAFDMSQAGQIKAEQLARKNGVAIDYQVGEFGKLEFPENHFDAIGLIYSHFPAHLKKEYYQELAQYLKPDGIIILEVFSKSHLELSRINPKAGGPKDINILFSTQEIKEYYPDFEIIELIEKEIELEEGLFHIGKSSVIRFIGKKN